MVVSLMPACVTRFMQQANATAKLQELHAIDSWRQREFVEAGRWATFAGDTDPNASVATACAEQLMKRKI